MSGVTTVCRRGAGGFSLIEMMVVLVILAIALLLGGPAFTDLIRDNRLVSSVYGVRATLNLARSEALARRLPSVLPRNSWFSTRSVPRLGVREPLYFATSAARARRAD